MTILWEFDEKHPKQVSAYGTQSWVQSVVLGNLYLREAAVDK